MGRAAIAKRIGFGWLALFAALGVLSCEQFDPVKSDNLCERDDGHAISMLCPQCSNPPFAWQCSECFKMLTPDPELCEPRDPPSPATDPDGGSSGSGGSSGGEGGEGGQSGAGGAGGEGGESGAGGEGEGGAGSGGMSGGPMSGAGGEPMVTPIGCGNDDLWCKTNEPTRPACLEGRCVECKRNEDCKGDQPICDPILNRCQTCLEDDDCENGVCNEALRVCIECQRNEDCTTDPIKNACDTMRFVCVDCVGAAGCDDPDGIKTTCHGTTQMCVDCLEDTDCSDPKPACNKQTRECVECTANMHCGDPVKGTCEMTARKCVDCLDNTGCAGTSKPQCETESRVCVECTADAHCASGHCWQQECVQCNVDADCPSATASHCDDDTHTCVPCASDAQCEHLDETPACNSGRCVECKNDTTCDGFACIRAQNVCSDVRTRSRGVCNECQADSMCMTGMACVPLSFGGDGYGNHCVYVRSMRPGQSCANSRPYSQAVSNLRSVDGATQSVCIPPSRTTCPGVLDATVPLGGQDCQNAADCGLGIDDASCNSDRRCTYVCGAENDCPMSMTCLPGGFCGSV